MRVARLVAISPPCSTLNSTASQSVESIESLSPALIVFSQPFVSLSIHFEQQQFLGTAKPSKFPIMTSLATSLLALHLIISKNELLRSCW